MICRYYLEGQKLNVADLNEITVLIDRSETALTEVALNTWRAGLVGPPHRHQEKDQLFYITAGEGTLKIGSLTYPLKSGRLVYVPATVVHQTVAGEGEALSYLLFNCFLDPEKEGHSSFAEHIKKVQHIRKQQAEQGTADIAGEGLAEMSQRAPRLIRDIRQGNLFDFGSNTTRLLLDRTETARCEAVIVSWPEGSRGAMVAHQEKEQTFFILTGSGTVIIGEESAPVKPGDVVFVPRNVPHTTEAGDGDLTYLCLNTYISEPRESSFEEMYKRIAPQRIKRWERGDPSVGE